VVGLGFGLAVAKLSDYRDPEDEAEFERLVVRAEELARENLADERLEVVAVVRIQLEELALVRLDRVPVVISDKGRGAHAYGLYQGDTVARDDYHDRIIIFRDTLLRDFGHDPDLLREQVTRTVRHELAHHLGADELGVRELGL
jgi:predicted Zn-dependent protease with MMP-like domain